MINKEDKFIYIMFGVFFLTYSITLWNKLTVFEILMYSLYLAYSMKSIYDIIYHAGYAKMYCYSEPTNQKLRYLVAVSLWSLVIIGHKFLFCNKLQLFTCGF